MIVAWCDRLNQKSESQLEREDLSKKLDPHKGLFLPYGCGAVLVKDGQKLKNAFSFNSDYLADVYDPQTSSPADFSPELTRHFRGLRLWFSLKLFGLAAFSAALEEKLSLAQYAYQELSKNPAVEMGPFPQLSTVTFRLKSDNETDALLRKLLNRGRVHLSSTRLKERLYLRLCILCFRSHQKDVDVALEEIRCTISTLQE